MNLVAVAEEIQHRIIHIFGRDMEGRRATNGGNPKLDHDPHFRDYVWFYEVNLTPVAWLCTDHIFSFSTLTMDGVLAHPTRRAGKYIFAVVHFYLTRYSRGPAWSLITFCKAG
jgi:hypothetical protein